VSYSRADLPPFLLLLRPVGRESKVLHADRCPDDGIVSISVRPAASFTGRTGTKSAHHSALRPKSIPPHPAAYFNFINLKIS
jgi:hypothetical protein